MEINEVAALGHGLAAVALSMLSVLMMNRWKDRPRAALIALAAGVSAIWAAAQLVSSLGYLNAPIVHLTFEWVRNIAWLTVLATILREFDAGKRTTRLTIRYGAIMVIVATILAFSYGWQSSDSFAVIGIVSGGVALSALALILAEQLFRNSPADTGSSLRYFCVGIAGIYVYDLFIFVMTIVDGQMNTDQWAARGYVNFIFSMPLVFAARRSMHLPLDRYVPRQFVFYSFAVIAIGTFVIFTLAGNYYIQVYGGDWSGILRIGLFVAVAFVVSILFVSRNVRARVRVFLMKSFLEYKYDYRKEWLRFISTLSESDLPDVSVIAVKAVAQIVDSPAGIVWVQEEASDNYRPLGAWQCELPVMASIESQSSLIRFLQDTQWVVDLNEVRAHPGRYKGLELDDWVTSRKKWWLIIPLFLQDRLFGFVVLEKSTVMPTLNFEDHDLLRTVGRHVATHIDQAESDRQLAEASQFGTYNRLTAFLMHDLNNLIAQQSLVVKNAEKHRHNPEFVDDAIGTIANSVDRMRRLMAQLSSAREQAEFRDVDLKAVLDNVQERCKPRLPTPEVSYCEDDVTVRADPERLTTMFEHLIRNAQDATEDNGLILVGMTTDGNVVTVSIEDRGCGMTQAFIRERLFRPFDSTKGSQSMGIGAYQAREYVRELGGQMEVTSVPGSGTTFDIRLPVV
jgi:putative PEP-CTERM system histidine kinase